MQNNIVFADQAERFSGAMGGFAQSAQQVILLDMGIASLVLAAAVLFGILATRGYNSMIRSTNEGLRQFDRLRVPAE